jgi:thiol-disulfide isomerase/thioredoxin
VKKVFVLIAYCFCLIGFSTQCAAGDIQTAFKKTITPDSKISTSQVEPGTASLITPEISGTSTSAVPAATLPTPTPAPVFIPGEPLENFHFRALDGTIINSSDQVGKQLIIVAWRSSCPFCKRYLPMLQKTYEMYKGDFEIWALNFRDSPEVIKQYVVENGLTFTIWPDEKGEVFYGNNINTTPTTLFINSDGVVEFIKEGIISEEAFIKTLEELEFIQK